MNLAYSKNFQKLNLLSTKTRKKRKIITTAPRARRESDSVILLSNFQKDMHKITTCELAITCLVIKKPIFAPIGPPRLTQPLSANCLLIWIALWNDVKKIITKCYDL